MSKINRLENLAHTGSKPAAGWIEADWRVLLSLLVITSLFLLGISSPLLSNLRADEQYFLQCAYGAVRFGSSLEDCYVPHSFTLILSGYFRLFDLTTTVIAYKTTVLIASMVVIFVVFLSMRKGCSNLQSACLLAVLFTLFYYIASNRGMEIRPEFFGICLLLLGLTPMFSREDTMDRVNKPIPVYLVFALLALSLAALMSLRIVGPAMVLALALIVRHLQIASVKLCSTQAARVFTVSLSIPVIVLLCFHFFVSDIFDFFDRVFSFSAPAHHSSTWKRTYLDIGLYEQFRNTPLDWAIVRLARVFAGCLVIFTLIAITIAAKDRRRIAERALIGFAVPCLWLIMLLDAKPFAYVVALEGALIGIVWCTCFSALKETKALPHFLAFSVGISCVVIVLCAFSNLKVRDMTIRDFAHGLTELRDTGLQGDTNVELKNKFDSRNFIVQLSAREHFCERFRGFSVIAPYPGHPICLNDIGSGELWDRDTQVTEIPALVRPHPKVIVVGRRYTIPELIGEFIAVDKHFLAKGAAVSP
jgi:hypothetical protein